MNLSACLLLAAAASLASAQETLSDPTRPPADAPGQPAGEASAGDLTLQTVIMGEGRKPSAIIGGQHVDLGGMIGGARLIHISDSEVVLEGPSGRQVLKMTPQASKRQSVQSARPKRSAAPMHPSPAQ
jgi:MSHA biogenesis protein MshK